MLATKHHINMLFYGIVLLEILSIAVAQNQRVAPGVSPQHYVSIKICRQLT